ncbi:hypothetical protein GCM10008955_12920 [Deinococcus malanensis]|uniref:Uncharacterized protein n=1 Tax=Deinococcus malanensis TaxID=1706855 RepID=A0ABQ2ET59_9DEIO|nr:hypothetical protein GCM10008955_12920 [Deinococcus malanensis]
MLEPGPFALDYLLSWPEDVTINGQLHAGVPVYPLIRQLLADPESHGLTPAQAEEARALYLRLAGEALRQEGGDPAWLEREFER